MKVKRQLINPPGWVKVAMVVLAVASVIKGYMVFKEMDRRERNQQNIENKLPQITLEQPLAYRDESLYTITGHKSSVLSAAFGAGGKRIISASADGTIKIWNVVTGQGNRIKSGFVSRENS